VVVVVVASGEQIWRQRKAFDSATECGKFNFLGTFYFFGLKAK